MIETNRFSWSPTEIRQLVERQVRKRGRKSDETTTIKLELPKPRRGAKFVRGPIPLDWIKSAIPCGRKSINVALALWYSAGFKRSALVKLTAETLREFDVTAETGRSILQRFERAGLVNIDRKRGRSPLVTIRATDDNSTEQ